MKMALDGAAGANLIRAYSPGRVRIRDRDYARSLIVTASRIVDDWEPSTVGQLRARHFSTLTDEPPEVVILGTGEQQTFPEPASLLTLIDFGIGYEVMDNAAACRTYNILLTEQRRVALALLIETPEG